MKAVIYATNGEIPISEQLRRCRQFCKLKAFVVEKEFTDENEGNLILSRGEFELMMAEDWDVCVAYSLNKFQQSIPEVASWADELTKKGKNFAIVDIDLSTTDPAGMYVFRFLNALNEIEVSKVTSRTKKGMKVAQVSGKKVGKPPYGYDSKFKSTKNTEDKGILVLNPIEADIVKIIFDCSKRSMSHTEICAHLKTHSIPTKTGKNSWALSSIRNILHNEEFYKGTYIDSDGEEQNYEWDAIL